MPPPVYDKLELSMFVLVGAVIVYYLIARESSNYVLVNVGLYWFLKQRVEMLKGAVQVNNNQSKI